MNAPSTFQHMMYVATKGLSFASDYINDVFILPKSMRQHLDLLEKMFRRNQDHGLKIKLSRCHFAHASVQLFGRVSDEGEDRVDKSKDSCHQEFYDPYLYDKTALFSWTAWILPQVYIRDCIDLFCIRCLYIRKGTSDLDGWNGGSISVSEARAHRFSCFIFSCFRPPFHYLD